MNFGELKADILAQIGRAPSDLCYRLVTADINESVRIAAMQAVDTFAPVAEYTLPTDFLEDVSVYHENGDNRHALESMEPSAFDAAYRATAWPSFYSISDGVMRLIGTEGGGTITVRYYQQQDDLSLDADTNAILTKHPAIYVYGVLAHHAAMIQNPEALSIHFPAYERAMKRAKDADNARRQGGNMAGFRPRTAP